jgi:hypothetical protein
VLFEERKEKIVCREYKVDALPIQNKEICIWNNRIVSTVVQMPCKHFSQATLHVDRLLKLSAPKTFLSYEMQEIWVYNEKF